MFHRLETGIHNQMEAFEIEQVLQGDEYALLIAEEKTSSSPVAFPMNQLPHDHPHVLPITSIHPNVVYMTSTFDAVASPLACHGDVMSFNVTCGPLHETGARVLFRQLLSALTACHAADIFHRDLKLDNLLLDEQFNLRVSGFGIHDFPQPSSSKLHVAPEIQAHDAAQAPALAPADVWSAGVALFTLISGMLPFAALKISDWHYRQLCCGNVDAFWHAHERYAPFTNSAKGKFREITCRAIHTSCTDLITRMLMIDPVERITLSAVELHPWINGGTNNDVEAETTAVRELLRTRSNCIFQARKDDAERAALLTLKNPRNPYERFIARGGGGGGLSTSHELPPHLPDVSITCHTYALAFASVLTTRDFLLATAGCLAELNAVVVVDMEHFLLKDGVRTSPDGTDLGVRFEGRMYYDGVEGVQEGIIWHMQLRRTAGPLIPFLALVEQFVTSMAFVP